MASVISANPAEANGPAQAPRAGGGARPRLANPITWLAGLAALALASEALARAGFGVAESWWLAAPLVWAQARLNGWRWGLATGALAAAWAGAAALAGLPVGAEAGIAFPAVLAAFVAAGEGGRRAGAARDAEHERLREELAKGEARFRAITETTPIGIFATDASRRGVFANAAFAAIAGADSLAADWVDCVHPEDRERVDAGWKAAADLRAPFRAEMRFLHPNGQVVWARVAAHAFGAGRVEGYTGAVEDVTEQHLVDEAFRIQARRKRVMLDNFPGLCAYVDRDLRYRFVSREYEQWLGRPVAEIEGSPIVEFHDPAVMDEFLASLRAAFAGERRSMMREVRTRGGRMVRERTTLVPDFDADGLVEGAFLFSVDMTDRLEAEEGLAREKERLAVTLQSIADAVVTVDAAGRVDYMNPVSETLTGWGADAALGRPVREVVLIGDESGAEAVTNPVEACLRDGQPVSVAGENVLCRRDGDLRAVDFSVAPISSPEGAVEGAVVVFRDVSASRRLAQQLTWQAQHDALTGLANRRQFEHCLDIAIDSARARGERHAMIYIDLDQFKIVNDTCGHAAGDRLLKEVSAVLGAKTRATDVLARLGGDEFGMLLRQCSMDKAQELAERMRGKLEAYRFSYEGKTFAIGGSFGVVPIDESVASIADVLRAADAACYAAKESGRNRVHRYQPGDREIERRHNEMEWVGRVRRALEENRFVLHGQPIVSLSHAGASHIEMLLRMTAEDGELVPPMAWIPAAERYGLMPRLDRWVIGEAFRYLGQCTQLGLWQDDAVCAINLSGASLTDTRILDFVHQELAATGIRAQQVCFEITETAVIANLAQARKFIAELRRIGVRFALDDFGAGMSSFGYLKALPVDYLKIDGSFVRRIAEDPVDHAMVEAINKLGHVMGIRTIAEFVETEAVLNRLKQLGVDYAQGHFLAKPGPLTPYPVSAGLLAAAQGPRREADNRLSAAQASH